MNDRLALLHLHNMEGIGWRTISHLTNHYSELSEVFHRSGVDASCKGLLRLPEVKALEKGLHHYHQSSVERLAQLYEHKGIGWLTIWDEDYPELLRQIASPPWILYYKGSKKLLSQPAIAAVGTRTPTVYGKTVAEKLARELSTAGMTVVSGLARGIDSAAHNGALDGEGSTIAVLGCSIEEVYPPDNRALYRRIAEQGLLLSEYPIGTKSHPGLFPQRNRIIAGLSLGVLVVEAASRSGSLITADMALEESRDVFAVPGPITSPKSEGALSLLKQGAAKIVVDVQDVLEEYGHLVRMVPRAAARHNKPVLTAEQQKIVDILQVKPMTIDELLLETQYNFGHLHSLLIHLLMINRIAELPGSIYTVP